MKVSVIVPVYNVKDFVVKCLESLDRQTLDDYEVIVVDDGSTDGSGELVDTFCAGKEKFHVVHKENGGLMSAWMEGVTHATGDYLGFVDSDDYVDDRMYEKLYDCAKEHDCDIVMCDRIDVKGGKSYSTHTDLEPGLYTGEKMAQIYENVLPKFSGNHITNSRTNKLFRRELFMSNTKYCEHRSRICEDRFITPACMFTAKSFYYLPENLYFYVLRAGSNHSMPSLKLQDAMELLYRTQIQYVTEKGLWEKYGHLVERANLNYLRLMIMRNFAGKGDVKACLPLAKRILESPEYNRLIQRYSDDLKGKLGMAVKLLFKLKSARLFVFVCSKIEKYQ